MTTNDERWMREALALAARGEGRTRPNPPVGAVLVKGNRIVGRGYHRRAGGPHAEVVALRDAGAKARGATLYVTLEPCCTWGRTPPCTDAVLAGGVARVVVSVRDPNPRHGGRGLVRLRRRGLDVTVGVCGAEGERLIAPFAKWITSARPFVTLKLGMSLDGKIGDRRGASRWITCPASRRAVQALRRRADAILVGAGTACVDDPGLLPRRPAGRQPYRVVADSRGRLPLTAKLLNDAQPARTILATTRQCSPQRRVRYEKKGAQVWPLPAARGGVSLPALCRRLGKLGILHLLCEGGGELAASLIRAGLVDELLIFVAPMVIGGRGAVPAVAGMGWPLKAAPGFRLIETAAVGRDLLIRARPARRNRR
ncbi:MAG: bifunctional diaminohydroxyphosphoribosylaminopyrimidine deaminase/5-amino-6-(5-phosphoribosylamino)uracil reductase RibD [Kiritimatiellae bacterium]|nr:bifunctional diaminohydroxyphosphoribosylaminopyrimidine deaminase/5-amino-6-(5-phosphoribosylamino)uracil reductase RibD [Kiritimatiellia bacterium]